MAGGEVVRVSDSARPGGTGAGAGVLRAEWRKEAGDFTLVFARFPLIHLFSAHTLIHLFALPRVLSPLPFWFSISKK